MEWVKCGIQISSSRERADKSFFTNWLGCRFRRDLEGDRGYMSSLLMKKPFLIILAVVLVLVVGAGAVIWLKLGALKGQLAQDLGDALGAKVEVASLTLDLWKGEVHAAGIELTNQRAGAPWDHGDISQATARFHLHDLLAPTLPLAVEVSSWHLVLHPADASASSDAANGASMGTTPEASAGSRHRVQVTQLSAAQGAVEIDLAQDRHVLIHGVAFDAGSNGGTDWTTQLRATSISAGSLQVGESSVELRGDPAKIVFSDLRLQCAQGMITGEGDVGLDGLHEAHATLKAVDVPVVMLVAVAWQMKLSGLASGNLTYEGNDQGAQAQGQLSVTGGKFNVLPFLGKITDLAGLPDITGTEVDQATTDFAWKDHVLHLTDIDVEKTDVSRISGTLDVDAQGQVDGHLKWGVPSTVVARFPQLQPAVFTTQSDDYSWTDVHVTGTPDHLQEDLTPRLLAAGVQAGGGLLNQGTQKAMDLLKGFLNSGSQ
jgi:hypothetical protein